MTTEPGESASHDTPRSDEAVQGTGAIAIPPHQAAPQPPVVRKLLALLQDLGTQAALIGFTVRVFDLDAGDGPKPLGYDVTDARGLFTIIYTEPPAAAGNGDDDDDDDGGDDGGEGDGQEQGQQRRLRLKVFDRTLQPVAEIDIVVAPDQKPPLVVRVAVPAAPPPPSPTIDDVTGQLHLVVPPELTAFLDERNIHTLADLRATGGLADINELPVPADAPIVRRLDAHANLNLLSADFVHNNRLIDKGVDSIVVVARSTRQGFVQAVSNDLGDFGAAQLQVRAAAQANAIMNIDGGLRAGLANGGVIPIKIPDPIILYPPCCACADCDAAVSPLAYLADLLDYALRHLTITVAPNPPQSITLDFLTATFLQPFRDLPAACAEVDRQERHVRLCIEVLRRYLAANPPAAAAQQRLDAAERAYREGAYTALLTRFGASYGDIRLARTANDAVRQAIAARLGIGLQAPRPDHLDALFLDPRAPQGDAREITEPTLERLLGLVDTRRDPLSDGAKEHDAQGQIARWTFTDVLWNRNTDPDGLVHLRVSHALADYTVEVFRDAGQGAAARVAHGTIQAANGLVALVEDNGSGLTGQVVLNYRADDAAITIPLIPNLLSWRLGQLRNVWRDQDRPVDRFDDAFLPAADREPVIDPDVISPDDLRTPVGKLNAADSDAPFDVWLRRRSWVDDRLRGFAAIRKADGTPDLAAMLTAMTVAVDYAGARKAAWPNAIGPAVLDQLARSLAQGQDIDATQQRIRADLNLQLDAFSRLMALRQKDQDAVADSRNPPVTLAEWREVYSLLTQAWKTAFLPAWRGEETPLLFGPADFWPSLREPQPGEWPPPFQQPLIDSDLLGQEEVAKTKPGDAALRLWEGRRAVLDQIVAAIAATRHGQGFDAMLRQALGDPNPGDPLPADFAALANELASGDQARIDAATRIIETQLFMTRDQFERLAQLRARDAAGQPVTAAQWTAAYALLTGARKLKQLYARWRQEEGGLPLIDPEILKTADLPDTVAGDPPTDRFPYAPERALALWRARSAAVEQRRLNLRATREANGLDAAIRVALGDPGPGDPLPHNLDLTALNADLTSGVTARASQAQAQITADLYMTVETFARLIAIKVRNDDPNALRQPTAAEWADAYAILASAAKEKRDYAGWRQQELDPLTGVDYWQGLKATLPAWRASAERRAAWRQTLQSRSEAPLIDPDLIGPGDLRDPVSGPVFDIWLVRRTAIAGWLDGFRNRLPIAPALTRIDNLLAETVFGARDAALLHVRLQSIREARGLDFLLGQLFGDPPPDLDAIAAALAANPADAQVQIAETLYLTIAGFQRLIEIRALDRAGQAVTPVQWNEVYDILTLGALVRAAMCAVDARRQGDDITPRLGQLGFTSDGFTFVAGLRDAAARQAPLLAAEWEDLYSILVQVRKERSAAQWRNQEARGIILGPDRFRIADPPPLQFPPPPPQRPAWRASDADCQVWLDQLQARIDQEDAVRTAYDQTVSQAEADLLPGLRDALLQATNPPANPTLSSLRDKARWITNHLLIDAETDGCEQTTRVGTAITTIQDLLWSVRSGLLAQVYPDLALDADEFDAEWTWIGGYANWRAAMFIFLYPENLLVPSLRHRQTSAFAALVDGLRANSAVGPAQACGAAMAYSDYFRDIANLSLAAACQTVTRLHTPECRDRTELDERSLLYFFATGGKTKTLYWSTFDAVEAAVNHMQPDFVQTFWEAVPGLDPGILVLAAVPFVAAGGDRFVYVFGHDRSQQKIVYVRYSRDAQVWVGSPATLDFPHKEGDAVTIVVKQRSDESEPPQVAVQTNGRTVLNRLNSGGDAWAGDNWAVLATAAQGIPPIVAMVGIDGGLFYLFARASDGNIQYRCFGNAGDPFWHPLGRGDWSGAFAWPQSDKAHAFWIDSGNPIYRRLQASDQPPSEQVSPGQNQVNIDPLTWSLSLFDFWLAHASGVQLGTLNVADVADLGGGGGIYSNVLDLLERKGAAALPPGKLAEFLDNFDKYIKHSDDWSFADDLLRAVSGSRIIPVLGSILNQTGLDLPDGAKGAALLVLGLASLFGPPIDPYYRPPEVGGTAVFGLVAVDASAPDAVLPALLPGVPQADTILVGYQRAQPSGSGLYWAAWTRDLASDLLTAGPETAATPMLSGPFDITERFTAPALQLRRQQIAADFLQNTPGPRSNLVYLEEAYYFVPVQTALQLQQRGQYAAALDWFRSVYDWGAPAGERKIYYGLSREESLPATFMRAPDWLLDPLNPHAIAETRVNSYTRFTLISLIRCLLQYADSEYTNGAVAGVVEIGVA